MTETIHNKSVGAAVRRQKPQTVKRVVFMQEMDKEELAAHMSMSPEQFESWYNKLINKNHRHARR